MISVRSEVQVFPGPPLLCSRRLLDAARVPRCGAIAQLGERLLCKQEVVGSIPSGSTSGMARPEANLLARRSNDRRRVFSDIVKRRSLRAAGEMKISCAAQSPAFRRKVFCATARSRGKPRVAMLVVTCLTAGDVGPISKQAGLSNQCPIMAASTVTIATPSGNGH